MVHLPSWIIQDGNYSDFAVGERRRFALEFHSDDLAEVAPGVRTAVSLGEGRYEVAATVECAMPEVTLIDIGGLIAYCDSGQPSAPVGTWLTGQVLLSVDCYSYYEIHAQHREVPPAVYSWTVTGLWRQTAPYITDTGRTGQLSNPRPRPARVRMDGPD